MNNIETLQATKDALDKMIVERQKTENLLNNLKSSIVEAFAPILQEIVKNNKATKDEMLSALTQIQIQAPNVDVPRAQVDVKIPEIKVPPPQVTVNVPELKWPKQPEIKIPEIKMPEFKEIKIPKIVVPKPEVTVNIPEIKVPKIVMPKEMDIKGDVGLRDVDVNRPLPVQLRDAKGKPVDFTQVMSMGGGGGGSISPLAGFQMPAYDYVAITYPTASTEQYEMRYKGKTVISLLLTYSDATKANLTIVQQL